MRTLFATGGIRAGLLNSVGLKLPLIAEMPVAENDPTWLEAKLYPNPATNFIQLDLSYDRRWVGQSYQVVDLQGQVRIRGNFQSSSQRIELNALRPGYYLLEARRTDGVVYKTSFVKL